MKTVDILRKAKAIYESRKYCGMCDCIRNVVDDEMLLIEFDFWVKDNIPLFCYSVARGEFGATGQRIGYWWDKLEKEDRLRYFDWLIEQYKDK